MGLLIWNTMTLTARRTKRLPFLYHEIIEDREDGRYACLSI